MTAEKNLEKLIRNMRPQLQDGEYVFISTKSIDKIDPGKILLYFREPEGVTIILKKTDADALGQSYQMISAWITLYVHSDLEAVGFTAAFSGALAKEGIACNVVAGYYHDHLFVPLKDGNRAIEILTKLSGR